MGKSAMLSDEAYAALLAAKERPDESLSQVILRYVPTPIRTFGDLERHLANAEGPLLPEPEMIRRVTERKARRKRHAD